MLKHKVTPWFIGYSLFWDKSFLFFLIPRHRVGRGL